MLTIGNMDLKIFNDEEVNAELQKIGTDEEIELKIPLSYLRRNVKEQFYRAYVSGSNRIRSKAKKKMKIDEIINDINSISKSNS